MIDGAAGGGGCGPNELVQVDGMVRWLLPTDPGRPVRFVGVLPDGVSATAENTDGSAAQVETSGCAFSVTGDLAAVTIHTKTDDDKTIQVERPADPRDPHSWPIDVSRKHIELYLELLNDRRELTVDEARTMVELVNAWRDLEHRRHLSPYSMPPSSDPRAS
jgi:hypothetical protein